MRKTYLLFIHLALLSLLLWWASPLLPFLFPGAAAVADSLPWIVTFGVLGFFTAMVFGTGYLLIPAMLRARLFSPRLATLHLGLAAAALGGMGYGLLGGEPLLWGAFLLPWFGGTLLFAGNVAMTIRYRRSILRRAGRSSEFPADRYGVVLTVVAGIYLLAATLGLVIAGLGPALGGRWRLIPLLHLYLLGFVANMIFGVGYHLIPRLLGARPHRSLAAVNAILPIAAPAFLAYSMDARGPLFAVAALAEAAAAVAFALNLLSMFLRRTRRLPPAYFLAASAVALLVGPTLGVAFALSPKALRFLPVHMTVNLVGFVSFMIFGVSLHIFPPFFAVGSEASYLRANLALGLGLPGLLLSVLPPAVLAAGGTVPLPLEPLGALLLLASAGAYTSSLLPSTILVWRTRAPRAPVGPPR